mmetsp:Transcript_123488/g.310988  ORF Transcript_123488/g.310988 Transcript_123488/m.310988 type:complete len:171 (-) Transcript_123488:20-532(-)
MTGTVLVDAMDVVGMLQPLQPRPTLMQILTAMAVKGTCLWFSVCRETNLSAASAAPDPPAQLRTYRAIQQNIVLSIQHDSIVYVGWNIHGCPLVADRRLRPLGAIAVRGAAHHGWLLPGAGELNCLVQFAGVLQMISAATFGQRTMVVAVQVHVFACILPGCYSIVAWCL